jgi:hypothetical protein
VRARKPSSLPSQPDNIPTEQTSFNEPFQLRNTSERFLVSNASEGLERLLGYDTLVIERYL